MKRNIREIDIHEYMPILIDLINNGSTVPLLVSGNSMSPFLVHHRDMIFISKPNDKLKKGDIVFFKRLNGEYVVHRIHHFDKFGQLFIIGDGQTIIEGPVDPKQIFGIVNCIKRKNKVINKKSLYWIFFKYAWIRLIKVRRIIISVYTKIINEFK